MDELAMHPTVKPVALVADAIRDCSQRGEIVLDPFGGSGTTLIAAENLGRPPASSNSTRLLRHHRPALGGLHRQAGHAGRDRRTVRGRLRSRGCSIQWRTGDVA